MKLLITACCLLVLLAACTPGRTYHVTEGHTHTYYRITYLHDRSLDWEITDEIQRFYHSLNPFDSLSIVSAVNMNRDVEVDSIFIHAFRVAEEVSRQTDGMFDITCAPLINLWGFGFSRMDSVTPARIDSLRQFIGFQKVRLEGNRVVKDDPRLIMNFSSIADGTVCDMIAQRLEQEGVRNYLVEFGGEMRVRGVNPSGQNWRLGITKPTDDTLGINQALEQIVAFPRPLGMATSGNYRNFYVKDGKRYAHTIDPRVGTPVQRDILSATIVAPDAMTADAFATAFMVLGAEEAKALHRKVPDIEYFIIRADSAGGYHTEYSAGFRPFLVETNR